jgi:hypothetical protein
MRKVQVPSCKDYKKLLEIDEERCLDCDFHLDCFPMDEETKKLMKVKQPKPPRHRKVKARQASLEEVFA